MKKRNETSSLDSGKASRISLGNAGAGTACKHRESNETAKKPLRNLEYSKIRT